MAILDTRLRAMLIHGPTITLRRLDPADLTAFQAYRSDPDVARYQDWAAMTDGQARAFLRDAATAPLLQPGHWTQIAIADRSSGALLGDMGIHIAADRSAAELGITLARAAQGAGRATQAMRLAIGHVFAQTPVGRIVLIADRRNTPSLRLIDRVGAVFSHSETTGDGPGTITEHVFTLPRTKI